jgi:hypothetical protein
MTKQSKIDKEPMKRGRRRRKKAYGKRGCGCLLFLLVICMIAAALTVHPLSLRLVGKWLRYEDKIVPADLIMVPRFPEDKNGELFIEAFKEFWAGDGKEIVVEDDRLLGIPLKDLVQKMAKERGIKEGAISAIEATGQGYVKAARIKAVLAKRGTKKVIIIVPSYSSRLFHLVYEPNNDRPGKDSLLCLIKPIDVSYFKKDSWWKNNFSRSLAFREIYAIASAVVPLKKLSSHEENRDK